MTETGGICIVTDSTSDVTPALAAELGMSVVPLNVSIDGETFLDGSITMAEFFRRMSASKELPKTSQPPVGAFADAFKRGLERCHDVVCVTISSKLSGTFDSAMEAARHVGGRVHVFDSLNLSWGEGFQAVAAARAAKAGASLADVMHTLEDARDRIHMVVGLDTLENLAKGGRIGRVSALVGGLLNLKVLLTVDKHGEFEPVTRARGTKAAMRAGVDWLAARIDATKPAIFGVQHAESPEKASWLEAAIRARFTVAELFVIETGPVIGTHTGTGWGLTGIQA